MSKVSRDGGREFSPGAATSVVFPQCQPSPKLKLDAITITPDSGGASHAAICGRSPQLRSESHIDDVVERANRSIQQATEDLEFGLELQQEEAASLISASIIPRAASWLQRIALLPDKLIHRAIRGFRLWMWDVCDADSLLRYLAKQKLRSKLQQLSVEQFRKYICETEASELMLDLGYNAPSIQRYQERSRLKKDWLARQTLRKFGLQNRNAIQFLKSPREYPLDQGGLLAEEVIEIGHNPALHPVASRAAQAAETPLRHVVCDLDEVLRLRQQVSQNLRCSGWSAGQVTTWLRQCSYEQLKSFADSPSSASIESQDCADNIQSAIFGDPRLDGLEEQLRDDACSQSNCGGWENHERALNSLHDPLGVPIL